MVQTASADGHAQPLSALSRSIAELSMLLGYFHACLNARIHSFDISSSSAPVLGTTPVVARNIETMLLVTASTPRGNESSAARAIHRFFMLATTPKASAAAEAVLAGTLDHHRANACVPQGICSTLLPLLGADFDFDVLD